MNELEELKLELKYLKLELEDSRQSFLLLFKNHILLTLIVHKYIQELSASGSSSERINDTFMMALKLNGISEDFL